MTRIVSVWLADWPIARLLRAEARAASASPSEAVDRERPLVLVAPGKGGPRLVALDAAARASGLREGEPLSNARSKVGALQSRAADPAADAVALTRLALWCTRYTPWAAPWDEASGADGLFLDITGCAHLHGGEGGLLADLARRLARFGLAPRLAVAATAGAAWGLARYDAASPCLVPAGEEAEALRTLPLAALRLAPGTLSLLRRLGFRRVGDVLGAPRAPLAARFGADLLLRLDQAVGRAPEPLSPVAPLPRYHAEALFLEPIASAEHVVTAARRLLHELARPLESDGAGARRLRLLLFRVDGDVQALDIGLAAPSRDPEHLARLIALRLEQLSGGLEAEFGFEAAALHVLAAEPLAERQAPLYAEDREPEGLARLIDSLEQRLGVGAVRRLAPRASHIPERAAAILRPGGARTPAWSVGADLSSRPLLLLPRPEPAEVMALVPDGPPRRFRWRRVPHQVRAAEGPERIAPEWWRLGAPEPTRDYYVVEDAEGRRFWLFRAGLYDRGEDEPRWFVHGVFT